MRALPEGIPPKAGQVPDWSECPPEGLLLSLRDNSPCAPWNLHEATGRHVGSADRQSGLALAPYRVRPPRGCCTLLNKRACPAFLRPLAGRPKRGDAKGGNALWRAFASFWRVPKGWRPAGAQPRPGMPLGAMPRQAHGNAQGAVPVAAQPSANPPGSAWGRCQGKHLLRRGAHCPKPVNSSKPLPASGQAQAGPVALQCAKHSARSYQAATRKI